jgi:hypothetical protein
MAVERIKGVVSYDPKIKSLGEVLSAIRAAEGVVTARNSPLTKGKTAVLIKVDPAIFRSKYTEEIENKVIKNINDIKGVFSFKVKESPFIQPEKKVFDPTPVAPQKR